MLVLKNVKVPQDVSITVLNGVLNIAGKQKGILLKKISGSTPCSSKENIYLHKDDIRTLHKPFALYIANKFNPVDWNILVIDYLTFWSKIYNSYEMLLGSIHYLSIHHILNKKISTLTSCDIEKLLFAKLLSCKSDLWLIDSYQFTMLNILCDIISTKITSNGVVLTAFDQKISKNELNLEDYE